MTKHLGLGVSIVLTMGAGCAITDYSLITDNDAGGTVNTHGRAYIRQSSQTAVRYPDGTDNLMWFVDQDSKGDRTLTTVNYFTTSGSPYKDDSYCSPDWVGCAAMTSHDPEIGDADPFDYEYNVNCSGARSICELVATSRYYGECGRTNADRMAKALNLLNRMSPVSINGTSWLEGVVNASNFTTILDNNNGATAAFAPAGDITVLVNGSARRVQIDLQNPVNRQTLERARAWADSHPGPHLTVTRVFDGMAVTTEEKLLTAQMGRFIDQHY